jgi:predicted DNA-binding transcriptional regulator AlpA
VPKEPIRFISRKGVRQDGGPSERQQSRLIEKGRFPKPVRLSEGRFAYVLSEWEQWKRDRVAERDAAEPPPNCDNQSFPPPEKNRARERRPPRLRRTSGDERSAAAKPVNRAAVAETSSAAETPATAAQGTSPRLKSYGRRARELPPPARDAR